jgi:hypothetical protein
MAFLEKTRITGELILQLFPRIISIESSQELPVFLNWSVFADGHQLDRPKKNLSEVSDRLVARRNRDGHDDLDQPLTLGNSELKNKV